MVKEGWLVLKYDLDKGVWDGEEGVLISGYDGSFKWQMLLCSSPYGVTSFNFFSF